VLREEDIMSLLKRDMLIERKHRVSFVMRCVLGWRGEEIEKTIARWSEMEGSEEHIEEMIDEVDREISRSKV